MVSHDDNSPLSERAQQTIKDGEAAWVQASSGNWDSSSWMRMGTALALLRQQTLREMDIDVPRGGPYNKAFADRVNHTKFATMENVTRSNLLFLMELENRIVLDRLLASWPPDLRARRTHPTTLAQHVRKELKPPKPAPQPKPVNTKPAPAPASPSPLSKIDWHGDKGMVAGKWTYQVRLTPNGKSFQFTRKGKDVGGYEMWDAFGSYATNAEAKAAAQAHHTAPSSSSPDAEIAAENARLRKELAAATVEIAALKALKAGSGAALDWQVHGSAHTARRGAWNYFIRRRDDGRFTVSITKGISAPDKIVDMPSLELAKAHCAEHLAAHPVSDAEEIALLRKELAAATGENAALKAKPPKPPLDPDSVAAKMQKTIDDQRAKMKAMREDQQATGGKMSHKTMGLISMAFHPDGGVPTREELDNAMKAFNAWKADAKKAAADKHKAR